MNEHIKVKVGPPIPVTKELLMDGLFMRAALFTRGSLAVRRRQLLAQGEDPELVEEWYQFAKGPPLDPARLP